MDLETFISKAMEDPKLAAILRQYPEMVVKATTLSHLRQLTEKHFSEQPEKHYSVQPDCRRKKAIHEGMRHLVVAIDNILRWENTVSESIAVKIAILKQVPTWPEFLEAFNEWFKNSFNPDNRKRTWFIPVRFLAHPEACDRYVFYLQQLLAEKSLVNCSESVDEPPRPGTFVVKEDTESTDCYRRWQIAIWLA